LEEKLATSRSNEKCHTDAGCSESDRRDMEEVPPRSSVGLGSQFGESSSQVSTRASNGWKLGIESLPMNPGEIGNGSFDFSHSRAAVPAGGKMGANLGRSPSGKFAVRGE
jgi:hypothetical protein